MNAKKLSIKKKIKSKKNNKQKPLNSINNKQNNKNNLNFNDINQEILIEELLIQKILNINENKIILNLKTKDQKKSKTKYNELNINENSMLLKAIITNFTTTISKINYKNGLFVGKLLYQSYKKKYIYAWYQESIDYLIDFLELCGYKDILFSVFSDKVVIKIPNFQYNLNLNLHTFESGLISGFISSSKNKFMFARELECSNNNLDICEFACDEYDIFSPNITDINQTIEKFMIYFFNNIKDNTNKLKFNYSNNTYSQSYYYLSTFPLIFNNTLNEYMKQIFRYIAIQFNHNLFKQFIKINKSNQKQFFKQIQQILNLLDIDFKVNKIKPLNVQLLFNHLNSKSEFIDLCIIFFNNLIKGYSKELKPKIIINNEKYSLILS